VNHLPINPLSPEEQQRIMEQMYLLMGKQVQSYHSTGIWATTLLFR